jgi:hypothetical protein
VVKWAAAGSQPGERAQERVGPGPVGLDATGSWWARRVMRGDVEDLVAQPGGFGAREDAVQGQPLGPGTQVAREQRSATRPVAGEVAAGQTAQPQRLQDTDAVGGARPCGVTPLQRHGIAFLGTATFDKPHSPSPGGHFRSTTPSHKST